MTTRLPMRVGDNKGCRAPDPGIEILIPGCGCEGLKDG
jgi:hypothetical protein